jgi:protein-disulfide isomerase
MFNRRLLSVLAIALTFSAASVHAESAKMTKDEVETIVKDYITNHPEVMMDSLKAFQSKQAQQAQNKAQEALKDKGKELYEDKNSPSVGAKKPDVTVVEFFDYHCGYCKKMVPAVTNILKDDKKVRFVFKEFPILSEDSEKAAKASLAVYRLKPEKYLEYHTALMSLPGKFDEAALIDAAKKLDIDGDKLKTEMAKPEIAEEIKKTRELAGSLAISGTPGFVVADQLYPGAIPDEQLKKIIQDAREGKGKKK